MSGSRLFDAVFFDLGQTLVRPFPSFPELFAQVCAEHTVSLSEGGVRDLLCLIDAEIAREQAGGGGFSRSIEDSRRFWTGLYCRVLESRYPGYPEALPAALFNRFSSPSSYRLYDDVLPALSALRAAGVRLAIISNWEAWAEEMVDLLTLRPFFDVTLISGVTGIEKPDARIFRMAIEATGVPAARALHVGDNPAHDCDAAYAVGITPVLLDRYDRHPVSPWTRITDLERFADRVLAAG
jgi:putative hydrolase of the HAD superfamily